MGTMTFRDLTAVRVDESGERVLVCHDPVTVMVEEMSRAELVEWEPMVDALNPGLPVDVNRHTVRGFTVRHATAKVVGVLLQDMAHRVRVEWYDPQREDFFYHGQARRVRHGEASILQARNSLPRNCAREPW
jgi:hypothetical protein